MNNNVFKARNKGCVTLIAVQGFENQVSAETSVGPADWLAHDPEARQCGRMIMEL